MTRNYHLRGMTSIGKQGSFSRRPQTPQSATPQSGALRFLRSHWPPKNYLHDSLGHRCLCTGSGWASNESARWRWLSPVPCVLGLAGIASCSLYITGTLSIAINVPFQIVFHESCFQALGETRPRLDTVFWKFSSSIPSKNCSLLLARRAVMRAATTHNDPADRRSTPPARLARPLIDAVFKLKKSPHSRRIHRPLDM